MRRFGLPVVPAIIGIILGPVAEEQMRRALQISNGDIAGLYNTWFSKTVYAVIVVLLVAPPVVRWLTSRRGGDAGQTPIATQHANVEGQ